MADKVKYDIQDKVLDAKTDALPAEVKAKIVRVSGESDTDLKYQFSEEEKLKNSRFSLQAFQINANIGGYKAGTVISISCDADGIPEEKYWRARLRDAQVDNCIEKITE